MKQNASSNPWKTNLFLALSATTVTALLIKWYLEKNSSENISIKNEQPESIPAETSKETDPVAFSAPQRPIRLNNARPYRRLLDFSDASTFQQLEALSDATVFQKIINRNNTFAQKDQKLEVTKHAPTLTDEKNKTPESTSAQAKLPMTGTAVPALSLHSSYSVLPSHTTSTNDLDTLLTPENSQEKMEDKIKQNQAKLLAQVEPDRAAWPTPQAFFNSTTNDNPEKAADQSQAVEYKNKAF